MEEVTTNEYTPEKIAELVDLIIKNPKAIESLPDEAVVAIHGHTNARSATAEKVYANLSIVNYKDEYLRKFTVTALIAYLYQVCNEYESEAGEGASPKVREFLDRYLPFDANRHVRAAHSDNLADVGRMGKEAAAELATKSAGVGAKYVSAFEQNPKALFGFLKDTLLSANTITDKLVKTAESITNTEKSELSAIDKLSLTEKFTQNLACLSADLHKIADPISAADTLSGITVNPPANIYYNFDRYITNNFEALQQITTNVYAVSPDIDFSCELYSVHKDETEARNYRKKYESVFLREIICIESGARTVLGPYKGTRDRAEYYTKNTEILRLMDEQKAADNKVGADIMAKAKRDAKIKSIKEVGPDHPALAEYSRLMNEAAKLGANPGIPIEEQRQIYELHKKAAAIKDSIETPDDTVRVDVFYPTQKDGARVMEKTHFFTEAEEPKDPAKKNK